MSWLIRSLAFQQDCFRSAEKSKHFTRLPLTFVTHSPARCSYFCYIKFLTLICLISHQIASCPMSHWQETRTFCLNRNGFLISRFHSFCFHCTGHFVSTFVSFARDFKIKISKTKSPRIDPFVSFPFNLLRNRSKKIDKGQKEKKAMGVPRNGRKNPPWGQGNERNSSRIYFLIFFLLTVF